MHPKYLVYLHKAYIKMVADILRDVACHGLTDNSHYFISFDTRHAGVKIPDFLRTKYPENMSIILQHQFKDLTVSDREFCVTLSFGGIPTVLCIPFEALVYFADPSTDFAIPLKFSNDMTDSKQTDTSPQKAEVIDFKSLKKS